MMASTTTSIPRFLLPQAGLLWRRFRVPSAASSGSIIIRYASTSPPKGSKPIVLEKPARFNPPSHGSRLPKKQIPRHYGGELSFEEAQAQKKKDYPGLPPPPDTWTHWFWNSRAFHLTLTMVSPPLPLLPTPNPFPTGDINLPTRALSPAWRSSRSCRTSSRPPPSPTWSLPCPTLCATPSAPGG